MYSDAGSFSYPDMPPSAIGERIKTEIKLWGTHSARVEHQD